MIGKEIEDIRQMTSREKEREGWGHYSGMVPVIVLEDGTKIYPSADEEGNSPGALFGASSDFDELFLVNPD